jgi:hypothetical protein
MSQERPVPENGIMSQEEQAALLVQTGQHTHADEADKLREVFGEPDEIGVYGRGVTGEGDAV